MARIELALHAPKARVMPFHYTEKRLAEVIGFEPMILISKTSALGQTKLAGNNFDSTNF